jgi:DNA-binding beta-propeller fold protein YncE
MKFAVAVLILLLQRPSNPALLIPQNAPDLEYISVPNPLSIPEGMKLGPAASVAVDSRGHLFVLYRGEQPVVEFDANGKFIRAFGEGLFTRPHGLRIDAQANFWVTDVGAHIVVKFSRQGQVLLTLGTKGQAGEWNEANQTRLFNEPNDVAIGLAGEIFIAQGHSRAEPRVLKFDKNGNFIKSWGGRGIEPGRFEVAHSLAFDPRGLLWVADRENQRIQVFDVDGRFIRQIKYAGLPCGIYFTPENAYMVNGFAGQLLKLDLNGNVLAATGKPGKALGEFGEAHYVAVNSREEIFVADPVNGLLQKFVKKR